MSFAVAISSGDLASVKQQIKEGVDVCIGDETSGVTPLMLAANAGNLEIVKELLLAGAPWNSLDAKGRCAGDYALANKDKEKSGGNDEIIEELLNHGVRCELILDAVGGSKTPTSTTIATTATTTTTTTTTSSSPSSPSSPSSSSSSKEDEYLKQKLRFDEGKILDQNNDAVMMGWEGPLMDRHAELICRTGGDVLNVGFGMGLVDIAIQSHKPRSHTIIEAHPDVYKKMIEDGWDKKDNVRILFGRWQDVIPQLTEYDGIFFDTFGEHYSDMREFHAVLPQILKFEGVYSFFNGLAASTNQFFHRVYCRLVELELLRLDLSTHYHIMAIDSKEEEWNEVRRKYWVLDTYRLPEVRHADVLDLCGDDQEEVSDMKAAEAEGGQKRKATESPDQNE